MGHGVIRAGAASALALVLSLAAGSAPGQVVNPADKQREMQEASDPPASTEAPPPLDPRPVNERVSEPIDQPRASYELPAVEVVGEPVPTLREEQRIGPYAQPRWTARRLTTIRRCTETGRRVRAWSRA